MSLRSDEVDGRRGPGKDYAPLYIYHVRGLPVQVVEETTDWRRICDPEGGVAWVHRSMLGATRTVMARPGAQVVLHRAPSAASPSTGILAGAALADVRRCRSGWCEVTVDGNSGWTPDSSVWGAASAAVCR
ncbi:MAG: SH3 domain-containing protein [Caulobacteraceae bacterium]